MSASQSLPRSSQARASEQGRSLHRARRTEIDRAGFRRHSVFLAEETVVFLFEGSGIESLVRDLVNDPARSGGFGVWAPLLDGTPALAREEFYWEAGSSD